MNLPKLMKNLAITGVNLAIFFFAANWVNVNIQYSELSAALKRVSFLSVLSVAILNTIVLLIFSYRLAVLTQMRYGVAFGVSCLGSGLNCLLPLRLGDAARFYYAKRIYGVSLTQLMAATVIEKIFDLCALGLMVSAIFLTGQSRFISLRLIISLAVIICVGALALFLIVRYAHTMVSWLRVSELIQVKILALQDHLQSMYSTHVSLSTAAMWITNLVAVYFGLEWFLPSVGADLTDATIILLVIALAIALPGAPSGLGVFEAGVVSYLTLILGVVREEALAAALLLHLAISFPPVILSMLIVFFHSVRARSVETL